MTTIPVSNGSAPSQISNKKAALKPQDFINMMITQLQNQDPLKPEQSSELLSQMSQIGQLQSATDLQSSLKSMVLQNQVGSASSLIGKKVEGLDPRGQVLQGTVSSVSVSSDGVSLELDTGQSLPLSSVTSIAAGPAAMNPGGGGGGNGTGSSAPAVIHGVG